MGVDAFGCGSHNRKNESNHGTVKERGSVSPRVRSSKRKAWEKTALLFDGEIDRLGIDFVPRLVEAALHHATESMGFRDRRRCESNSLPFKRSLACS